MTPKLTQKIMLAFFAIVLALSINARDIIITENGNTGIEVKLNTYQQLSFANSLDMIRTFKVKTDMGIFNEIMVEGYSASQLIADTGI